MIVRHGRPTEDGFADIEPPPEVSVRGGEAYQPLPGVAFKLSTDGLLAAPLLRYLLTNCCMKLSCSGSRAAACRQPDTFLVRIDFGPCAAHPKWSAAPRPNQGDCHHGFRSDGTRGG